VPALFISQLSFDGNLIVNKLKIVWTNGYLAKSLQVKICILKIASCKLSFLAFWSKRRYSANIFLDAQYFDIMQKIRIWAVEKNQI